MTADSINAGALKIVITECDHDSFAAEHDVTDPAGARAGADPVAHGGRAGRQCRRRRRDPRAVRADHRRGDGRPAAPARDRAVRRRRGLGRHRRGDRARHRGVQRARLRHRVRLRPRDRHGAGGRAGHPAPGPRDAGRLVRPGGRAPALPDPRPRLRGDRHGAHRDGHGAQGGRSGLRGHRVRHRRRAGRRPPTTGSRR